MMVDLSPAFDNIHPANVDLFSDAFSAAHVAAGFLAGLMNDPYRLGILALYEGYQIAQAQSGEPWSRTGGELIEFGLGLIFAGIAKGVKK